MVRIILSMDFFFLSSLVVFEYLQLEIYRNRYQTFNVNIFVVCHMLVAFSLGLFLLCLDAEDRYCSQEKGLRIPSPDLFVLSASDAVLVVIYLCSLIREVPQVLIFLMPFPGLERGYNFYLFLNFF